MHPTLVAPSAAAQPIWFVTPETFQKTCATLEAPARAFIEAALFEPKAGKHTIQPWLYERGSDSRSVQS